jgi:hypothetical protein
MWKVFWRKTERIGGQMNEASDGETPSGLNNFPVIDVDHHKYSGLKHTNLLSYGFGVQKSNGV